MNKPVIKCLLVGFILTVATSCEKYLDTKPYSFTSVDKFYETAQDAELALTGCYSLLNTPSIQGQAGGATFRQNLQYMLIGGNDECVTRDGFANVDLAPYGLLSVTPQMQSLNTTWFFLFAGINRTNYLIANIDGVNMSETRKQEIKGEALFLRGLYYMYTAMLFGGVPVYTSYLHDPEAPRESLEKVYAQIISDYTEAYQLLPHRATRRERANKWSAAGMLVKVYTYLASAKKFGIGGTLQLALNKFDWVNVDEMYNRASSLAAEIINEGGFKLTEKYDYLFRETTQSFQYEESLFSIQGSTSAIDGNYNLWVNFLVPTGATAVTSGGSGALRPLGEMFYKYHESDFRRHHNLTGTMPANSQTEMVEGVRYYVPQAIANPRTGLYSIGKFRMRDPSGKPVHPSNSMGDMSLLRYADILLLYAECLHHVGDEAGARDMLRSVRRRISPSDEVLDALEESYRKDNFLDELLDERSRELCFEGWRRIDLVRFNRFESELMKLSSDLGFYNSNIPSIKENFKPYKIWMPIPRNEIEVSYIEQNDGYE